MKKNNLREIIEIKKMTSEFKELKKLKGKCLIRKDKSLLGNRIDSDKKKINKLIKSSLNVSRKSINEMEGVKKDFKEMVKILNIDVSDLDSKLRILKHQIKEVSKERRRIVKKKNVFKKKIEELNDSLKVKRSGRRVVKSEKLKA